MATSKLHPIIRPAEEYEHPRAPVRDDSMLGPTEDLDREPDGFPHVVLSAMVALAIVIAATGLFLWTRSPVNAVLFLIVAVPSLVYGLSRWAERRRDRLHPSV